ncbi:uncharacterized protein MJAP1_002575 [Malassezia japonica]|uniref:Splicing factor Cactin n=1 Tax=Malassezia japonica TaxID=223818 RepID=A0AAF0EZ17_9BASI|nr:uncharacterized protein MJAP1_002575 [Malassezia japonica]WFD39595.1 hypothetical protein MJAP1_002575 [Malassezia japonica]
MSVRRGAAPKRAASPESSEAVKRREVAEARMYSVGGDLFQDGEKFHWKKKEAQASAAGLSREDAERRERERRTEAMHEVERLNARRMQRERERRAREQEKAHAARTSESAATDWAAKEDQFHLEQAKLRASIRVRENRAQPIDVLVMHWMWARPSDGASSDEDDGAEAELAEPTALFSSLLPTELAELHQDIQSFVQLERDRDAIEFWRHMLIVCDDRLRTQRGEASGAHVDASIVAETDAMLAAKSADELYDLQCQVRAKLRSGEPLDVEYWESLLRRIVVWRSVARLREVHARVLDHRIAHLQRRQRKEGRRQQTEMALELEEHTPAEAQLHETWDADMEPAPRDPGQLSYAERRLPVLTVAEQRRALVEARRRILRAAFVPRRRPRDEADAQETVADQMFRIESERALGVEEETFNEDVSLGAPVYQWQDKYRARKPRYFNRVHTGYEWNKYNQTHYDAENPPPKVVQGYKFNIFYPDLIDSTKAPSYKILREKGSDTALLRFSAGPPYEDIAFRIVDREWEFSHRKGFRCTFERGILQLYFNFKRLKYRK